MAWNEPGKGSDDKDPWGNKKKGDGGPPDLDDVIKNMKDKVGRLFGGKGGKGGSGGGKSGSGGGVGITWVIIIGLLVWAATGIYIVDPAERAVELRFGVPVATKGPGPHWHYPFPIERVEKKNVSEELRLPIKSQMLTADRNLIRVELAVSYKIKDINEYLFNVRNPPLTMRQALDSALREVVGSRGFDDILGGGGSQVLAIEVKKQLQSILNKYKAGLRVTKVAVIELLPPADVYPAFVDANKAENDAKAEIERSKKYKARVVLTARGKASVILEQASAYKNVVVQKARGEANAFTRVLSEYEKAPEVTRKRMYIETMQEVLKKVNKVLVKVKSGNSLLYLPIDRYLKNRPAGNFTPAGK